MKKYYSLLLFLFITISSFAQVADTSVAWATPQSPRKLMFRIACAEREVNNITMYLYDSTSNQRRLLDSIKGVGYTVFNLNAATKYIISIQKPNYITNEIAVNTAITEEALKHEKKQYKVKIDLVHQPTDSVCSYKEPILKFAYSDSNGEFIGDMNFEMVKKAK